MTLELRLAKEAEKAAELAEKKSMEPTDPAADPMVAMVLDISTIHDDEIAEVARLQNGEGDALHEGA